MTIQNSDTLLVGRDDLAYYTTLQNSGLATLNFVENIEINISDRLDGLGTRLQVIESGWDFSVDTEISTLKNFKVGDDDLFVNVSNNHVGIGTHNPQKSLDIVSSNPANRATIRVANYSNDNKGPWYMMTKGRGTEGSKGKVQYGDVLGELYFTSWTGSNTTSATIRGVSTTSENDGGGKIELKTRGSDGLKTRLYTQASGRVAITKGLILSTEDTDEEYGTFTMRDYTDNDLPLDVNFTKYRGNNPQDAIEEGGVAPASNLNDRLLPGDGVVRFTFGGWDGAHRRNLASFVVNCVDDNLNGEVRLKTKKVGTDGVADRIVIDGDGDTHIKNGNLILERDVVANDITVTGPELGRVAGAKSNIQEQLDVIADSIDISTFDSGLWPNQSAIADTLPYIEQAIQDRATENDLIALETTVENIPTGVTSTSFTFRTLTSAEPASKQLHFNNSTPANVTEIYISDTNTSGTDLENVIPEMIKTGTRIYIQNEGEASEYLAANVSSLTRIGQSFTIGVTDVDAGTLPKNNAKVAFAVVAHAAVTLGNFDGVTIRDDPSTKEALQDLEDAVEERISLTELKSVVAASTSFADFQTRVAAL